MSILRNIDAKYAMQTAVVGDGFMNNSGSTSSSLFKTNLVINVGFS